MARQVQVLLVDDIDQSAADRNVAFSIDGEHYEIDLSKSNIDKLHAALEPFIQAGRKAKGTRSRGRGATRAAGSVGKSAEVREWARSRGMQVSERGRVSKEIMEAYEAAH